MTDTPYVLLSCCMSIDGYLDDAQSARLQLSNDADFDRVDDVRASCDAIFVGAATIRRDNPRLLVRSTDRRARRTEEGLSPSPIKVTVTRHGQLDPSANFFSEGPADKIVYCASLDAEPTRRRLGGLATVVDAGEPVDMQWMVRDLGERGVRRLMVEGGRTILTQFLSAGLADEFQLVVAPFFVGDSRGCRLVDDGQFPWHSGRRAALAEVRPIGDVVLLRYALSDRFGPDQ